MTPLFWACSTGKEDIVRLLLRHDADVDQLNKQAQSPLYIAAIRSHGNIVRILLSHGASLKEFDRISVTSAFRNPCIISPILKSHALLLAARGSHTTLLKEAIVSASCWPVVQTLRMFDQMSFYQLWLVAKENELSVQGTRPAISMRLVEHELTFKLKPLLKPNCLASLKTEDDDFPWFPSPKSWISELPPLAFADLRIWAVSKVLPLSQD